MEKQTIPYSVTAASDRSRYYMGGRWTFLATGKDTNGQFALMECRVRKGIEPPRHIHTHEDETYYLVEGEMLFVAGDEEHHLKAGDFIFLPKGVPHHFKVKSDTVKFLVQVAPAGLEELFMELSKPADTPDLPPAPSGPPPPELIEKIKALQKKYGIVGMDHSQIKTV